MPDVAVVTDTTHYLPRETVAELGVGEVSLYVNDGERAGARGRHRRPRRLLRRPAHGRHAADHLAALDRRLPGRLRAAGARRPRHRLDPHLGRDLGHGRGRPAGRGRAGARPARGSRSSTPSSPAARSGMVVLAAVARSRAPAPTSRRSPRAPARRRTPRACGSRSTRSSTCSAAGASAPAQAWLGGALKIKPILTFDGEIVPDRARAHLGPRLRADGRLPALAPRRRRRRLGHPAHPGARRVPSAWSPRGREIFGREPLFVSEIGPVIGAHVGPGAGRRRRHAAGVAAIARTA